MKTLLTTLKEKRSLKINLNGIRSGFLHFLMYSLLFLSLIFSVEILLILLSVADVVLPWTSTALELINRVVF